MKTSDFDYELPREPIAQTPVEPRDHSRLMVVSRSGGSIAHRRFYDLPEYLRAGDVIVLNDTRVVPARLHGTRSGTGGRVELLLLSRPPPPGGVHLRRSGTGTSGCTAKSSGARPTAPVSSVCPPRRACGRWDRCPCRRTFVSRSRTGSATRPSTPGSTAAWRPQPRRSTSRPSYLTASGRWASRSCLSLFT